MLSRAVGIPLSYLSRQAELGEGNLYGKKALPTTLPARASLTGCPRLATSARMKNVGRLAVASLFAFAFLCVGAAARAEMRVAVVDVQRAVMQTEDGLRAQANLKKVFDSRQQELNRKQTELGKQKEEIEKQAKVLSKDALQKRVDDWQKQMVELQTVFMEYNKELEKKQKEMTDPIFEKVMSIVKRLATSENFDLVMDKQTVAYVRTDLDLTDKCIQIYNSGGAAGPAPGPGGPPPQAPAPKLPSPKP
jgi:outer membrane protein